MNVEIFVALIPEGGLIVAPDGKATIPKGTFLRLASVPFLMTMTPIWRSILHLRARGSMP
jgi:hypothetical protein